METFIFILYAFLGLTGFFMLLGNKQEEKDIQELFRDARQHLDNDNGN